MNFEELDFSIYDFIKKLFYNFSSISGEGPRYVLKKLNELFDIDIIQHPSGKKVFDWVIPQEWNIKDAYIEDYLGNKVIDMSNSNLHVMNYSEPVDVEMDLEELMKKLHSLPEYPDWIPYRTSYYNKDWGFCLSHNSLLKLKPEKYRVFIDSEFKDGFLTYGEMKIEGRSDETVLLSTYICHPSMGNDNLSGLGVLTKVCQYLKSQKNLYYNYKCIFVPETIGTITWLYENQKILKSIKAGLVLYCIGDRGGSTYKRSRDFNSPIDRAAEIIMNDELDKIIPFSPTGSDERQYCSPGINLPIGALMRTPNSEFAEYHTSADNLDFISSHHLEDSYKKVVKMISVLENDYIYNNLFPYCEPQLGKRDLYRNIGGQKINLVGQTSIKWILNYSDGESSLVDIAKMSKIDFFELLKWSKELEDHGLIEKIK